MNVLDEVGFFVAGFGLGVILLFGYMTALEKVLDLYFEKKNKSKKKGEEEK